MPTDHPTPSPAPASGAETTYCAQCVLNGSGRFPMRDGDCTNPRCVLYMRHLVARPSWLALPTPPSDAGTSERETPCRHCHRTLAEHEIGHAYCHAQGELPVSHPEFDQEYEPAAPAAEGPHLHVFDGPLLTRRSIPGQYEVGCACGARRTILYPAAALPGAEAGTPKLADPTNELAVRQQIITELSARLADLTARHNELRVTMIAAADEAAALTSEVARLTQERDAARDAMVRYSDYYDREVEHNAALIAERRALTSEVRALREDKARLDWLDGMARLHEKPVFDVSSRLDGERFTVEFLGRHRYDWFHAPTLREAIDAARLASPSPTGAPAEQQKHEG